MIIYNILIGILILLLIYIVIFVIQNYNSNTPSPVNPPPSPIEPVEPVKPHKRQPVNPPVLPLPTSTWTQDNIIELDSYLRKFFANLFLLNTVPLREPIKDDTYKYIEEAIMDKYSYTEYKNIFVDFSKYEYIGRSSDNLYYWQNKFFKPIPFPSDDNINLAVFILENLDKYQPLTKLSFENMYNYYGGEDWGDNMQQAEDCIYDTVSKYNLIPITYIFFTTLYTNLNLSIGFNRDSYPKDNNYISIIQDYFNKKSNPIDDYCVNKLGIK